ncbi:MAG: Rieske 2Fe-2S domain-containing protein [Gammaproteobacteria bacterium]|nr:Rieske 2Fe-2S domain-containing protein [Gammaproteobacteria bacterium]MBU1646576.1 Rieske 2Fe-2S domain-containing protein [Gammaproteobacteria bacterium]MBU1972833.1 Rieske 2Fe-2S domain-containing protein [Gammaproteobacteria bacterium]
MAGRERLICASDELVDGGPGVRFEVDAPPEEKVGSGGTALAAFVVRHQGRVHAYLNRCGHIPVELDWQHGQFFDSAGLYLICATHGALYDPASGRCVGGRCNGRGLTALEVTERAGTVYLLEG